MAAGLALCIAAGWHGLAQAVDFRNHDVRVAIADESEPTKRIVEGLQKKFPSAQVVTDFTVNFPRKKNVITIAVGPSALRTLLAKNFDGVVISIFTSSQAYRAILENAPKARANTVTAIYAEPSPFSQMQLISMLYKRRVRVAALVSDKTAYLLPVLSQAAAQANIDLTVETVSTDDGLNRVLNRVAHVPVILAIPDSTIYSADNIRTILVTAYRHNQAVVGFSASLVTAGAMASTFSSIEDVLVQTEELLLAFAASGRLPEPQFPKYFDVVLNDHVARSINVVIDESVRRLSRKPGARSQ
jgi:ABC-type uncharacterized transport system substrate-binding protein